MHDSQPNRTGAAPAAALALLLVLTPLVFARCTLEAFTYNKAVLLQLAALALAVLAWPRHLLAALRNALREPLAGAVLLLGLSAVLSTVFSVSPRTSLQGAAASHAGLGTVLGYAIAFFVARASCLSVGSMARAACIAAAGAAACAALQVAGLEPMGWDGGARLGEFERPFGTLGHPNLLGAYLAGALPLILYLAGRAATLPSRGPVAILSLGVVLLIAALAASLSRAAWLAAAAGMLVYLFAAPRSGFRWRWAAVVLLAVGAGLLATAWLGGAELRGSALERLRRLCDGSGRYEIWRTAALLFADRPWLGSGLDTFQLVFGSRQTPDYWQTEWSATPSHAHNEILHTLATQGLLGGAALLLWGGGLVRAVWRTRRHLDAAQRPARAAVVASLAAFHVQALFGFIEPSGGVLVACLAGWLSRQAATGMAGTDAKVASWPFVTGSALAVAIYAVNLTSGTAAATFAQPGACLLFAFALGAATWASVKFADGTTIPTERRKPSPQPPTWPWQRRAAAGVAVVLALFGILQPYRADWACQAGESVLDVDSAAALRHCEEAVALAPAYAIYWTKLAAATQAAARQSNSADEQIRHLRRANAAADRAVALVPADASAYANRGRILAELAALGAADSAEALAAYDRAIAAAPRHLLLRVDAGNAALICGLAARARQYFLDGRAVDPRCGRFALGLGAVALAERHGAEALVWLDESLHTEWQRDLEGKQQLFALLAAAHLEQRHAVDAERWARVALAETPERIGPHYFLAGALELEGRPRDAAVEYRAILALAPGHPPARDALRRLGATP